MTLCQEINLHILGESLPVTHLLGEESVSQVWTFDLTIQLSLTVDVRSWLNNMAKIGCIFENGRQRMIEGEITSVKSAGFFSSEEQVIVARLSSSLHRLQKAGGSRVYKDTSFKSVIMRLMEKNYLLENIKVIFSEKLSSEKVEYIQQGSKESDFLFMDRFCRMKGCSWLLRISVNGIETICFFKKMTGLSIGQVQHQGKLNFSLGLSSDVIYNKYSFFEYKEKLKTDGLTIEMSSLSANIALGDTCEPTEKNMVISIKHFFGLIDSVSKISKYRNTLSLSLFTVNETFESCMDILPSSPFQYGFINSNGPYAMLDDIGSYAVKFLLDEVIDESKKTHMMRPCLGYGGAVSDFGTPTGMQSLWYHDTEVLLSEINSGRANGVSILGTLASSNSINPVTSSQQRTYQWRTPGEINLSFEGDPKRQSINWSTKSIKNRLVMGNIDEHEQGVELNTKSGTLWFSGSTGISLFATKSLQENVTYSRHNVIGNNLFVKNKVNKIHYESLRNTIFDFHQSMRFQSTQAHWKVQEKFFWSARNINLMGVDRIHVDVSLDRFSVESEQVHVLGKGPGKLNLGNSGSVSGVSILDSGKIIIFGSGVVLNGDSIIKGSIQSNLNKHLFKPTKSANLILELKEPNELPVIGKNTQETASYSKELLDLFEEKIEEECSESEWIDSAGMLNENSMKFNGMIMEGKVDKNNATHTFSLSDS